VQETEALEAAWATRTALGVTAGTGCTQFLLLDCRKNSRGKSSAPSEQHTGTVQRPEVDDITCLLGPWSGKILLSRVGGG